MLRNNLTIKTSPQSNIQNIVLIFRLCNKQEIKPLQTDLQKTPFYVVKHALLHCKTCPFAMQYMPFYNAKGRLLLFKEEKFLQQTMNNQY